MKMGALRRPTASRNRVVSALTWSGVSQLRLNRMRPQGLRSARKRSSSSFRTVPAHPTMSAAIAADFATRGSVAADQAVALAGGDQRIADPRGGFARRNRPDAQPITRGARYARLGHARRQRSYQIPVFDAQAIKFRHSVGFAPEGGELGQVPAGLRLGLGRL